MEHLSLAAKVSPAASAQASARARRQNFKSPLMALAASFAAGIVWEHVFPQALGAYAFLVCAALCILLGLILFRFRWDRAAVCLVVASMAFSGVANARRWHQRFPRNHVCNLEALRVDVNAPVRLEGRVVSTPYRSGSGLQVDVEAQRIESGGRSYSVTGKVRLRVEGGGKLAEGNYEIRFDDLIRATALLRRPHTYLNPGNFDYRGWMENIEDVYWIGTVRTSRQLTRVGHSPGLHFEEVTERIRQRLLRGIDDLYPPWSAQGRYGAVLKAVLWGDRTSLDSTTIDDFRRTGLYHLLVIAGLHVGLLTLLWETLLRWLGLRQLTRTLMVLGFLLTYASLVEQRAATLRATLMISLYLVARLLDRQHTPLNAIGGVALLLLFFRPAWLLESGFQLSFSAALLIVGVAVPILRRTTEPYRRALLRLDDVLLDDHFSPRMAQARLDLRSLVCALRRRVNFLERFPALARAIVVLPGKLMVWLVNMLIFSAVLQLGLLLPMVEIFHRVAFAGVGLNALAIPVMTVLLALALPINLLSVVWPPLAGWLVRPLTLVMVLLFRLTHLPGLAMWLSYRAPNPPVWVGWGFCAAFVLAALALRYARRLTAPVLVACGVFVAVVAVCPFAPRLPHGVLRLTALDCGQGNAILVVTPSGATMLLDAGGSRMPEPWEGGARPQRWNSGEDIVSPFLWSLGIKKLDVVAMTEENADHAGGLYAIVENFRVGEFWHTSQLETPEFATLLAEVAKRQIPTRTLLAGDELAVGGALVRVLWPKDPAEERPPVTATRIDAPGGFEPEGPRDDGSLVLRIGVGAEHFLVVAGAGGAVQEMLDSREARNSQVVALGGTYRWASPAGSEFLAGAAPRVAIVSGVASPELLGPANTPELDGLGKAPAEVFFTVRDGATTVETMRGALVMSTYRRPNEEVLIRDSAAR